MTYKQFEDKAGLPSEEALLARLRAKGGETRWPEKGISAAYFVAKEGNFTVRLTGKQCRRTLKHLADAPKNEDICTFSFSKPNHRVPYRMSLVSVRFERSDREAQIDAWFQQYGAARFDRVDPNRVILWRFQVENDRYEARYVADQNPNLYRFELTAKDLFAGGVRYGRELKRMADQDIGQGE